MVKSKQAANKQLVEILSFTVNKSTHRQFILVLRSNAYLLKACNDIKALPHSVRIVKIFLVQAVLVVVNKLQQTTDLYRMVNIKSLLHVQCSLTYLYLTYPEHSLIRTPVWEPISILQQKVAHLSGNSVIRTVSLGTEVSG